MIEAVVQIGSVETAYRRAGSGRTVLLLVGEGDAAVDWLFEQLAVRFRTIAPLRPGGIDEGGYATLDLWLRGLIDGLGLQRPALVAGVADARSLLRFATIDPERVDRIALVVDGETGRGRDSALVDGAAAALHPLLVVTIPGPDDPYARRRAMARLVEFLDDPRQVTTGTRSVS
jgi:pimeloyl-ACP methyl ester carboxylesterase